MGPTCFCDRANKTVGRHNQDFHHHHGGPTGYPKSCLAAGLSDITSFGYCLDNGTVLKVLDNATLDDCCRACQATPKCGGYHRPSGNKTLGKCAIISSLDADWTHKSGGEACDDGYKFDSDPTRISDGVLGGCKRGRSTCIPPFLSYLDPPTPKTVWYSLPAQGECQGPIGEDGCTWKTESIKKKINSSCVEAHVSLTLFLWPPS